MRDRSVADIIDTAIQREEEAYDFYLDIRGKVADAGARETIAFIAEEEKKHKAFLVDYREGRFGGQTLRMGDVVAYHIAENLDEPEVAGRMKPEDVFLVASHREMRSHLFYSELAAMHDQSEVRDILLRMANEELRHKEKMEYLYANTAFPQTAGG